MHVTTPDDPLETIVNGDDLPREDARATMDAVMDGEFHPIRVGGLLAALRTKGATVDEITGFAQSMREHGAIIHPDVDGRLVDTCGTGGAPLSTFNISTLSAFVAAGGGVPVAKHGNRAVTSKCGSADVLEALGADIELPPDRVEEVVEDVGVGFLFAPTFHPAMKHAVEPRQELGIRTVFNVLGPLTNPAEADGQVLGVYDEAWVEPLAEVLAQLGVRRALVVHGRDGLDEVSPVGETAVAEVRDGEVTSYTVTPGDVGLPTHAPDDVAGKVPDKAARLFLDVLEGKPGAPRDTVLLNAGAAFVVGDQADSLEDGVDRARQVLDAGDARETLAAFVEATGGELTA